MLFSEDIQKRLITDSNQTISLIERESYISEWRQLRMRNSTHGKMSKTGEMIAIIVSLGIIILMVAMILHGTVLKDSEMFQKIMGVFFYAMIYFTAFIISLMYFMRKIKARVYDPARNAVSMLITGLGVILCVPAYMIFYKDYILVFGLPAIYFLFAFLFVATERQRLYTRKADARCVGYARRIAIPNPKRFTISCYISPVFEIEVNGERIQVLYDRADKRWDSDIELGSTVEVDQHKDDPTRILSHGKKDKIVLFIAAAVTMTLFIFILLREFNIF